MITATSRSFVATLTALFTLLASAEAQVFRVDINNGPGTDFTSIAAAVTAVPDGATLIIESGTYTGFEIVGKSLTLIGRAGVLVENATSPTIRIADLGTDQFVSLRRISWTQTTYPGRLDCEDCAGTIVFDSCVTDPTINYWAGALYARSCDRIFLRNCCIRPGQISYPTIEVEQSNLTLTGCLLRSPWEVFDQTGGLVHVSDCRMEHNGFGVPGLVDMHGGVFVMSSDTEVVGATMFMAPPSPAVWGTGTAIVDPSTSFSAVATQAYGPGIAVTTRMIPRLDAATQFRGGTASATLAVAGTDTGALCVGFAAAPYALPVTLDSAWLEPGFSVHAIGGAPSVTGGYPVPNANWVIGIQITWQGAVLDSSGTIALSNPNAYVHF